MVSERERVKKTENRLSMVSSFELEAQSQTRDAIVHTISLPYHISNYESTPTKHSEDFPNLGNTKEQNHSRLKDTLPGILYPWNNSDGREIFIEISILFLKYVTEKSKI